MEGRFTYEVVVSLPQRLSTQPVTWQDQVTINQRADSKAGLEALRDAAITLAVAWARRQGTRLALAIMPGSSLGDRSSRSPDLGGRMAQVCNNKLMLAIDT